MLIALSVTVTVEGPCGFSLLFWGGGRAGTFATVRYLTEVWGLGEVFGGGVWQRVLVAGELERRERERVLFIVMNVVRCVQRYSTRLESTNNARRSRHCSS